MAASDSDLVISISTDLATIRNQLKKFGDLVDQAGERASKRFEKAGKSMDAGIGDGVTKVQRRINDMVGIADRGAKLWSGAFNTAGAELDRLAAKFDPLIAAQQKYLALINEINVAQAYGALSGSKAVDARLAALNAYNAQASKVRNAPVVAKASAQSAVDSATVVPNRGADVAAYASELDKLRAKYSPLFAAQREYLAELADIKRAYAVGAIPTIEEYNAAIANTKSSFATTVTSIKGVKEGVDESTKSLKLNRNGMLQLQASGVNAFQALAAGMGPLRVAQMEGAQVIGALVQGTEGVGSKVAAAMGALAAPEITVGLAAGAAGVAALMHYMGGVSTEAKSAEDVLKEFKAVVDEIGKTSSESAARIKDMIDVPKSYFGTQADAAGVATDANARLAASMQEVLNEGRKLGGLSQPEILRQGMTQAAVATDEARAKIVNLVEELGSQKISAQDAYDALSVLRTAETTPPSLDETIDKLRKIISDATTAQQQMKAMAAFMNAPAPQLKKGARPGTQAYVDEQLNLSGRAGNTTMADLATKLGQQQIPGVDIPVSTQKPSLLDYDPNKTSGRHSGGGSSAPHLNALQRGSQSTDAQLQQLQARLGVLQSINPLLDDYGASMAEATKKQQLLSDAEKAGVQLSPTQLADIDKQAAAYGRMTGAVNEAQAAQDRLRQNMEDLRSTGKDVLGGFIKDLEGGKSAADALAAALQKIADKLLDSALNGLFDSKSNGGSDILGGLGSLFGLGGGGFTQTPGAGLFDSGGYTGPGGKYQPAGIVHKGEVVFSQADVARNGGVAMVEALRRGYANGGPVAMPSVPSVATRSGGPTIHVDARTSINAPNADKAGLARLETMIRQRDKDLPATIVQTVRKANSRNYKLH